MFAASPRGSQLKSSRPDQSHRNALCLADATMQRAPLILSAVLIVAVAAGIVIDQYTT
jgi:hypothetical protein